MDFASFIAKWEKTALTERSASQQHFLDLCELLAHPKPAEADPAGEWFTFERGATKQGGGDGWADVWKRGYFGWEYKGKHKDLDAAYNQLLLYREDLENPPLLVVCDMERIIIHTNFTNTAKQVYEIPLREMGTLRHVEILRAVFFDPNKLRPGSTSEVITTDAARHIAEIAMALRGRGLEAHAVAHFLDRIVFCFFAEDIGLLPEKLFTKLLEKTKDDSARFGKLVGDLFEAMAHGGDFGLDTIRHFNGNLFNSGAVLELTAAEIASLLKAAQLDWSAVDASIFGTLFERGMDPAKRAQLGAHYTSRADIETLVEPVVMTPLRREWAEVQAQVTAQLAVTGKAAAKARNKADALLHGFLTRLGTVTVLDPACGSGNFLFVTLQKLKDLEKEVIVHAMSLGFSGYLPAVGPWQLYGIELNEYAHDLAQMTVWIGYLQWTHANGFRITDTPILRTMDNFQCKDAILDLSDPEHPKEAEWPKVDYIVGNPPFLGGSKLRKELGDRYVDALYATYLNRVPGAADLVCYWFEKGRNHLKLCNAKRIGFIATQAIRAGANRKVIDHLQNSGEDIFFAESDRSWVLDGAAVRVSMIAFDNASESQKFLNGISVARINPDLTVGINIFTAKLLRSNSDICYRSDEKGGPFDIDENIARCMLESTGNPNGRPNSDVIRVYINGIDVTNRPQNRWLIDFGCDTTESVASCYELPFDYVRKVVHPVRIQNRNDKERTYWWLHRRPAPDMRQAMVNLERFIATPRVAKHRLFVWLDGHIIPDCRLYVFACANDYLWGVLHSRVHEVWSLATSSRHGDGDEGGRPTYNITTCFETFPLPRPTVAQEAAIAEAARELDTLRNGWLNPAEWVREEILEFPGSVDGPWARYVHHPDARGIGTVRYPRLVARDSAHREMLAKRTLTNLYNQRPAWLDLAHRKLDAAVFAAYDWDPGMSDDKLLAALLALNLERATGRS